MTLLDERSRWLARRGETQWGSRNFESTMSGLISNGFTWIALNKGEPIATVSLSTVADMDFWSPTEAVQPALYMSKMATSLKYAGRNLGHQLTWWAYQQACESGLFRLRWDAWRTNCRLHNYYRTLGATQLRIEHAPQRNSGALFELSYVAPRDVPAFTNLSGVRSIAKVPGQLHKVYSPPDDNPSHDATQTTLTVHSVSGFLCPPRHAFSQLPSEPLFLECLGSATGDLCTVYHPGDQWRVTGFFPQPITKWPPLKILHPGLPYRLVHVAPSGPQKNCELRLYGWG